MFACEPDKSGSFLAKRPNFFIQMWLQVQSLEGHPVRRFKRLRDVLESASLYADPRKIEGFRKALAGISPMRSFPRHVVSRGDTLWDIARIYSTSAHEIQAVNRLANARSLQVGQQLVIPVKSSSSRSLKRTVQNSQVYHRVRRGETLSAIAGRYRVSLPSLQRANDIRNRHQIRTGQRLAIPRRQS